MKEFYQTIADQALYALYYLERAEHAQNRTQMQTNIDAMTCAHKRIVAALVAAEERMTAPRY